MTFKVPRELRARARILTPSSAGALTTPWPSTPTSATRSLRRFIAGYDLGELLSFKGIAEGVENTNYLVQTTHGPFILTLYEKRVGARRSALLPRPDGASGRARRLLPDAGARSQGPRPERACRAARRARHLPGRLLGAPADDRTLRGGGRALAALHLGGRGLSPCSAPTLSASPAGGRCSTASPTGRTRSRPVSGPSSPASLRTSKTTGRKDLPAGVIHADLFPDNVFFLGDRLSGLIDFYFACNDALAYDLAVCLNAWCFEPDRSFNITKGRALLRGYEERAPADACRARGAADAGPRRCAALPPDPRLRLAQHADRMRWSAARTRWNTSASCASTAACARSPTTASRRPCDDRWQTGRRSTPTAPAREIPGRAAGARSSPRGDNRKEISGGEAATTNNRMELMAAI